MSPGLARPFTQGRHTVCSYYAVSLHALFCNCSQKCPGSPHLAGVLLDRVILLSVLICAQNININRDDACLKVMLGIVVSL